MIARSSPGFILPFTRVWKKKRRNPTVLFVLGTVKLIALSIAIFSNGWLGTTAKQPSDPCSLAVDHLIKGKIQLVAFDFDFTIVNIHTGGRWKRSAGELAKHVRPDFQCFIHRCLDRGLHVSVATFSTQTNLISTVLAQTIQHEGARTIPIFGYDDQVANFDKGKQSQLLLSMNHFNKEQSQRINPITPDTTLLIDDDRENIRVAEADGYKTIYYRPGSSMYQLPLLGANTDPKHENHTA